MHPKERKIKCKSLSCCRAAKQRQHSEETRGSRTRSRRSRQSSVMMSRFRRGRYPPLPCLVGTSPFALFVDDNLVVHAEFTLGHSAQVAFHYHPARHVGAQHLTCAGRKGRGYRSKTHNMNTCGIQPVIVDGSKGLTAAASGTDLAAT